MKVNEDASENPEEKREIFRTIHNAGTAFSYSMDRMDRRIEAKEVRNPI